MKINFIDLKCKKCKITLSDFEVLEKNSFCIDCYNEEHKTAKIQFNKPKRLRNKRIFYT